jgi:hypothetical protein
MKTTPWTKEQDELLTKMYSSATYEEMVTVLNHSYSSIRHRAWGVLKLKRPFASGSKCGNWKGGKSFTSSGYILIRVPGHPGQNSSGYVFEHIIIWEKANNSLLPKGMVIHHINGVETDNRIENLQAMTKSEHCKLHSSRKRQPVLRERIAKLEAEIKELRLEIGLLKFGKPSSLVESR